MRSKSAYSRPAHPARKAKKFQQKREAAKILVVDDEEAVLEIVARMLKKHDYAVDCVDGAPAAMAMTDRNKYDFIFIDFKMPGKDGFWFMKNADLPLGTKALLITSYVTKRVIDRMFKAGICGYLMKPFDEEEVLRHLRFHGEKLPVG